jgi:hypothetical protein
METRQQSASDWEALLRKCATDQDYRTRLTEALNEDDDAPVAKLLEEIGIAGEDTLQRVHALRAVRGPMIDLANAFGGMTNFAAP